MPNPRVLVVGTGAIGGYYGGRLAQAGARVSVVSRSDYDVVRDNGIQVKSFLGDFKYRPEQVLRRASEYDCRADYIIVATKVLPEVDVYELIREAVGPETTIVLIQNGIEIEGPFVKAFPDNEVISAVGVHCCKPDKSRRGSSPGLWTTATGMFSLGRLRESAPARGII
jgi:2-dehydropantoate 2-reductase